MSLDIVNREQTTKIDMSLRKDPYSRDSPRPSPEIGCQALRKSKSLKAGRIHSKNPGRNPGWIWYSELRE